MPFLVDSFTHASDVDLASHVGEVGATWTDHPHANYTATFTLDSATDRIWANGTAAYYASGVPPSADYSIEADFYLHSAISQNVAICVRVDTTADTMVLARLNNGTSWEIREIVNGGATPLGSSTNQLPSAGTSKRGKLVVQGTQGFFYVEGVLEIGPVTLTVTAIGRAGVRNAGAATASTGIHLDNVSANPLYAAATLFRGRNFTFFDDEEVNRFEFWPAISTATVVERSASVTATASVVTAAQFFSARERAAVVSATAAIVVSSQFFSVRERSAAVTGTGVITTSGTRIVERSASVTATAATVTSGTRFSVLERASAISATASLSISGQFFTLIERSVALNATATVESSGSFFTTLQSAATLSSTATITTGRQYVPLRSVAVSATASTSTSGERVVERSTDLSAIASIATSARSFSVTESAVSLTATAVIESAGVREVERAVSVVITVSIGTAAQSFTVFESAATVTSGAFIATSDESFSTLERSAILTAIADISVAAEFFSILTSRVVIDATVPISTTPQREIQRSVSLSTAAHVIVAGQIEGQPVTHERMASISAAANTETTAMFFSVPERAVTITATTSLSITSQRELQRSVTATATVIAAVAGHSIRTRSVSLTATAGISTAFQRELRRALSVTATVTIAVLGEIDHVSTGVYERGVSLSAVAEIRTGREHVLASVERTFVVESGQREFVVPPANRIFAAIESQTEIVT